ncbi:MAG: hypothetical protein JNK23_24110 [Opitutaceae bacterium]|nr:hypothetical protein [Opitutaceae bacterium]
MSRQLVYPTKARTEAPFYDIPFAVNIPFEVPFDGGMVRVFCDVNIIWDAPEQAAQVHAAGRPPQPWLQPGSLNWHFHHQGIYRMDGAPIAPGSVTWEESAAPGSPEMSWQTDAPFPLMLSGALPTAASNGNRPTRIDVSSAVSTPKPRRAFTNRSNEHDGFMLDRPVVLRPAAPGWYALWFTMNPELPWWPPERLRPDDTLRARLIVHYMVTRRERFNGTGGYFTRPDLAWLWEGATEPPTRAIDPNLVRAHTVEIPLVLRRDGWVFDRAVITRARPANDYLDKKLPGPGSGELTGAVIKASAQPSSRGMTATYTSSIFERRDRSAGFPSTPARTATMTWDIAFPPEIMDGGAALIEARGGLTKTGGDSLFQNRPPASFHEDFLPQWIYPPVKDPSGVGMLLEVVRNYDPSAKAEFLSSWAGRLGDPDGARYWHLARGGELPAPGQSTRFTLIARPISPSYVNAHNRAWLPLLYKDLGPQPLFTLDAGPWRIEALYRRKKDPARVVTGAPVAGPANIANEKDEFWAWFPSYTRLLHQADTLTGQLTKENAIDRTLMLAARHRARLLLTAFQAANDPGGFSDWFASSGTRATMSDAMIARLAAEAGKANTEAFALKTAILQRVEKMRVAREAVIAELRRVSPQFIDRHPQLTLYERDQRAKLEAIDIHAALGTGDLGLFQSVMARASAQPDSLQPEALLALAQLQLENGDTTGALESLRIVTRQQPQNRDAGERLRDLECSFLKVALEKSQGAIAAARKHFYGYLNERGYAEKDQAWVGGVRARGLSAYDTESAWAVFSTGVTGAVSGLLGRAEEEARALDATERDMTVAFLGAHAILRLRTRGHTLAEIKSFTTERIQQTMQEGAPKAPALTRERALHLGLAIHQAFLLPELKALLSENSVDLRAGLAQGYWNARDVGNTWAEWVGDLTSPKNLLMNLLPMSIGSIGGQGAAISYWSRAEAAFIKEATGTGYVDTGTMMIARLFQMDRALGAIGATESGVKFMQLVERSQKYQESFGLLGQAGWTLGKMVAASVLQGLATYSAETLGGPRAAALVEALLLFGGDTDLLIKFLDGARISRRSAHLALDRWLVTAEGQERDLRRMQLRMVELQHMLEQRHQGKQLPPLRRMPPPGLPPGAPPPRALPPGAPPPLALPPPSPPLRPTGAATKTAPFTEVAPTIDAPNLPPTGPRLPNGQPGNNTSILLEAAEDGLLNNTDNGAAAAAKQLEADLIKEADELAAKAKEARLLAAKLATEPPTPPLPSRVEGSKARAPEEFGGYELPPQPAGGSYWERATRAKFAGDYKKAEENLLLMKKKSASDALAGKPLGAYDMPLDLIDDELALVRELHLAPGKPTPSADTAKRISEAIPDDQATAIFALNRTPLAKGGATAPVKMTEGGGYIIKEMVAGKGIIVAQERASAEEVLEWMVNAEIIGTALRHAADAPMPGIHVKPVWRTEGGVHKLVSAEMAYRRVPGRTMEQLTPGEQFLFHEQLSEHHGLDVLFGDYDGKSDNFMAHAGVAFKIDSGMADPRGLRARFFEAPANHPRLVHGLSNGEYWYINAFNRRLSGKPEENAGLRHIWRLHTAMTSEPALRGVNRLKTKLANPVERGKIHESVREACRKIYGNHPQWGKPDLLEGKLTGFADETLKFLEVRFAEVENAIRQLNNRNGMPPVSASSTPRRRGRVFPSATVHHLGWFHPEERQAA